MKLIKLLNAGRAPLLAVLLFTQSSFAIINSVTMYLTKDYSRKIIIMGEYDTKSYGVSPTAIAQDAECYRQLLRYIAQISQSSKKSVFYLEYDHIALAGVKLKLMQEIIYLRPLLALFAESNKFKMQNLTFRLDNKLQLISQVITFINYCTENIGDFKKLNKEDLVYCYKSQKIFHKNSQTFGQLFQSIEEVIKDRVEQLSKLDYGFIWIMLLQEEYNKYKSYFKKYDFDRPYIEVLIEALCASPCSNSENLDALKQMENNIGDIYHLLLRIDYLISMFNSAASDYETLIYCIDYEHIEYLNKYLTGIYGLTRVSLKTDKTDFFIENIEKLLSLDEKSKDLTIAQLEEQIIKANVNKCAKCQNTESLNRCSKCKKVYYCSQACQKAHWALHKLNCAAKCTEK